MKEQLKQYVALLFAGAQNCEDIQQEILQNTLDRYDDLIAQGKKPEAAYRLAIAGIGDINEILEAQGSQSEPVREVPKAKPSIADTMAATQGHKQRPKATKLLLMLLAAGGIILALIIALIILLIPREETVTLQMTEVTRVDSASAEQIALPQYTSVYSSPSLDAKEIAALTEGTEVTITRRELVGGKQWAYITEPAQGWVPIAQSAEPEALPPAQTSPAQTSPAQTFPAPAVSDGQPEESFSISTNQIREISVNWAMGSIEIVPGEGTEVVFFETRKDTAQYPMSWELKQGKLTIDACEKGMRDLLRNGLVKNLTLQIPVTWVCPELDINAASSALNVRDLMIQQVELESAGGQCSFTSCTVGELDIDTASGDVFFSGRLSSLEISAASASFVGVLTHTPNHIEMESASGSLDLTLPSDAGFALRIEGLHKNFQSDFDTYLQNGAYISGNGSCLIEMESLSGDVIIRKGNIM